MHVCLGFRGQKDAHDVYDASEHLTINDGALWIGFKRVLKAGEYSSRNLPKAKNPSIHLSISIIDISMESFHLSFPL
jgi:hypothetical protein